MLKDKRIHQIHKIHNKTQEAVIGPFDILGSVHLRTSLMYFMYLMYLVYTLMLVLRHFGRYFQLTSLSQNMSEYT